MKGKSKKSSWGDLAGVSEVIVDKKPSNDSAASDSPDKMFNATIDWICSGTEVTRVEAAKIQKALSSVRTRIDVAKVVALRRRLRRLGHLMAFSEHIQDILSEPKTLRGAEVDEIIRAFECAERAFELTMRLSSEIQKSGSMSALLDQLHRTLDSSAEVGAMTTVPVHERENLRALLLKVQARLKTKAAPKVG